jgi:hypothetical protein
MARVAIRLVLAALLALISAQAAAPAGFEQERPAMAIWHRRARTVLAASPASARRGVRLAALEYCVPVHSSFFAFGRFVRPPPVLLA